MTTEELRSKLTNRIDALLAHTLLVHGEDRQLLTALRGYVSVMSDDDLKWLRDSMTRAALEEKPDGQ